MPNSKIELPPIVLVIFGGSGDLTSRKLIPALYNLFLDGWLPERFMIIGTGRTEMDDQDFKNLLYEKAKQFSRRNVEEEQWSIFSSYIHYMQVDPSNLHDYDIIKERINHIEEEWQSKTIRIFYQATPPDTVKEIVEGLKSASLTDLKTTRIVLEKPFGHDLHSAIELNRIVSEVFDESQIYRIDHYLGKETVQNILAFRFANALFEPIWDRRYIDHVQITVAEQVGVEGRGGYYEHAGALRDMIQNHLLQIMCLIAMEPPVAFNADEVRNRKIDVLRAVRNIPEEDVHLFAARGQYGPGWIEGKRVPGYRQEPKVSPNSPTETFAALKLFIDNWRWQGVPFYLRSGKALAQNLTQVIIQLKPVPHSLFSSSASLDWQPNRIEIDIQPVEGIALRFHVKQPGMNMQLSSQYMSFRYSEAFHVAPPEAYETLLLDVMRGDTTLFMRADQVECAWHVITPILNVWQSIYPVDFPNYAAGSWGPESADALIAQDGRRWIWFQPSEKV